MRAKKVALKRTVTPTVALDDFYIGSTVAIYGRQLQLKDFGDNHTKLRLQGQREEYVSIFDGFLLNYLRTLGIIKQEALEHMGKIIDVIYREGFRVFKLKMFKISPRDIEDFAAISKKTSRDFTEYIIAMVLQQEQCTRKWKDLMGMPVLCY